MSAEATRNPQSNNKQDAPLEKGAAAPLNGDQDFMEDMINLLLAGKKTYADLNETQRQIVNNTLKSYPSALVEIKEKFDKDSHRKEKLEEDMKFVASQKALIEFQILKQKMEDKKTLAAVLHAIIEKAPCRRPRTLERAIPIESQYQKVKELKIAQTVTLNPELQARLANIKPPSFVAPKSPTQP